MGGDLNVWRQVKTKRIRLGFIGAAWVLLQIIHFHKTSRGIFKSEHLYNFNKCVD